MRRKRRTNIRVQVHRRVEQQRCGLFRVFGLFQGFFHYYKLGKKTIQNLRMMKRDLLEEPCLVFYIRVYKMSVCESIQWTHPLYVCMSTPPLPVSYLFFRLCTLGYQGEGFFSPNFIFISAKAAAFSQPCSHHLPDICGIVVYTNIGWGVFFHLVDVRKMACEGGRGLAEQTLECKYVA